MRNQFLSCLLITLSLVPPSSQATDRTAVQSHYLSYHKAGKAVVAMALTKRVDVKEVEKQVDVMVADAAWIAGEYGRAFPEGGKLLKVVVDHVKAMRGMSFKELEHEWHDLHYFDAADRDIGLDLKAEDNEHFTDPIHAIVHPLMVLDAARRYAASPGEEDLKSIKEEMEEGLEQMEKQSSRLLKKKD
jgi:hypothetical protein